MDGSNTVRNSTRSSVDVGRCVKRRQEAVSTWGALLELEWVAVMPWVVAVVAVVAMAVVAMLAMEGGDGNNNACGWGGKRR